MPLLSRQFSLVLTGELISPSTVLPTYKYNTYLRLPFDLASSLKPMSTYYFYRSVTAPGFLPCTPTHLRVFTYTLLCLETLQISAHFARSLYSRLSLERSSFLGSAEGNTGTRIIGQLVLFDPRKPMEESWEAKVNKKEHVVKQVGSTRSGTAQSMPVLCVSKLDYLFTTSLVGQSSLSIYI